MDKKEIFYYTQLLALTQLSREFDIIASKDVFGNECTSLEVTRTYTPDGTKTFPADYNTFINFRDNRYTKEDRIIALSRIIDSTRKYYTGMSSVNFGKYGFQPEVEFATAQVLEAIKARGKEDYKPGDQYIAGMEDCVHSLCKLSQYLDEESKKYTGFHQEKQYKVIKTRETMLNCATALLNRFFLAKNIDDTFINKFTYEYEKYLSESIYAGLLATKDCPITLEEHNLSCNPETLEQILSDLLKAKSINHVSQPDKFPTPYTYGIKKFGDNEITPPASPIIAPRPANIIEDNSSSMER